MYCSCSQAFHTACQGKVSLATVLVGLGGMLPLLYIIITLTEMVCALISYMKGPKSYIYLQVYDMTITWFVVCFVVKEHVFLFK